MLLDPRDVSAWLDAMSAVVNDGSLRNDLRGEGSRGGYLHWQRTARLTLTSIGGGPCS